jgi:hypothetical protein
MFIKIKKLYSSLKTLSLGSVHDPALRGSEFNGFAGVGANRFGVLEYLSIGVLTKTQTNMHAAAFVC